MRIVLDTNQFVSALIRKNGHPAQIVQAWRGKKVELAVSSGIVEEVYEVLHRPHIKDKYHVTDKEIEEYVQLLQRYTLVTPGKVAANAVKEDPDDDAIIACAIEAQADYIVTGDPHLLKIGAYHGISIIRAVEFLRLLKS